MKKKIYLKKEIKELIKEIEKKIETGVPYRTERAYLEGVYSALCWIAGYKNKINI